MDYLLDTSVYSQPLRRRAVEASLLRWKEAGDPHCAVSRVTVAEVEWGLHGENRPERWRKYHDLLAGRLPVLETLEEVWREFSRLKARQQRSGKPVADLDLLIAATALRHGLVVATLNAADFSRVDGLAWEDWSR